MSDMIPDFQTLTAAHPAEGKAVTTMISSRDFTRMMKSTAFFTETVVQINLRATQEFLRAKNSDDVLELQLRFMREYTAVLMHGTLTLVGTIEAAAAD